MKSTELRLGNYINIIDRTGEVHLPVDVPFKILQIELFNCEVLQIDKNPATVKEFIRIPNQDISPITITEEWLTRFGFEKHPEKEEWLHLKLGGIILRLFDNRISYYLIETFHNDKLTSLKYVHQLQNLYFALTGEELLVLKIKR